MAKVKSPREYPPLYEKAFPIVLGIIGVVLATLLIATLAVALQFVGAG